jgi:hypothetical protein
MTASMMAVLAEIQYQMHMAEYRAKCMQMCETDEERSALLALWAEEAKKAEEARKHRELCQAIRDSRPRGFGVFW